MRTPVTWETVIRSAALALICFHWSLSAKAQAPEVVSERSAEASARALDQALVQSALSAFEHHDYPSALALFKRASVSAPSLTVRLYLARSRVALGLLVDAAADYRSVVSATESVEASASERRAVAEARNELAQLRPRIPSIEVTLGEAEQRAHNLRLLLDGRSIPANAAVPVDTGHHEIVASDADGERSRVPFDVGEGEAKRMGMSWLVIRTDVRTVGGEDLLSTWSTILVRGNGA